MKVIFFKGMLEVLDYFSDRMIEGAKRLGADVYVVDCNDPSTFNGKEFSDFAESGNTIVFLFNQIGLLLKDERGDSYWDAKGIPVYDFVQDNPRNFDDAFDAPIDQLNVIVLDKDHKRFFEKYYPWIDSSKIYFMPNGGTTCISEAPLPYHERDIDILYVGTCNMGHKAVPVISCFPDGGEDLYKCTIESLLSNPSQTVEEAVEFYCENCEAELTLQDVKDILTLNANYIMDAVRRAYKLSTMHALEQTGARIEIYGDNWEDPAQPWGDNVTIHGRVTSDECNRLLGRSKIGLNCMPWYKDGCSERVFNTMLNGAVCLTDPSKYLEERFTHQKELLFYDMTDPEGIYKAASWILNNPDEAAKIAHCGYEVASQNDTWQHRMEEVLKLAYKL